VTVANDTALVLFSGGQDSTVCLAWALERFACVETAGFAYGQRHAVELDMRPRIREHITKLDADWKARLGDDHLVSLDALAAISDTALTRDTAIEIADSGLPTTFVPGRNLIFFCFAGAIAYRRGARHDLLIEDSHSCYLGDRAHRHDWGYGCGTCPACQLRANGFAKFMSERNAK
jgi:7-cyano-7-deazaguanine synthase